MNRPILGTALAASLFLAGGGAAAQNTTDPATATPPAGSERPGTTSPRPATPPPATEAPPRSETPTTAPPPEVVTPPVVVVPQTQTAPPPIELPASEPYPNGFADPTAPYGNDLSVAVREEGDGFDWGLLGLLGLLGLFGLYRRREGYTRTVHSERYDDRGPPVR